MHTAFFEKLEGGPGGALERADAQTRHLFKHYQRTYEQALSEAQDPEEVTEVGANGTSSRHSLRVGRGGAPPSGSLTNRCCSSAAAALSDRAASPAASPALLLHPPLPAPDSVAYRGSQRQQLRRCHAPRGLR